MDLTRFSAVDVITFSVLLVTGSRREWIDRMEEPDHGRSA